MGSGSGFRGWPRSSTGKGIMVYVLELESHKWYIGHTVDFHDRMRRHFTGKGSLWTRQHKPLQVVEVIPEGDYCTEKEKTLEYMLRFGWENVRGSVWCQPALSYPPTPQLFSYYCPWFATNVAAPEFVLED